MATKQSTKLDLSLVEPEHVIAIAAALQTGAAKYGRRGFLDESQQSIIAAMLRHLSLHQLEQRIDDESGLPHLWHVLAGAAILVSLTAQKSELHKAIRGETTKPSYEDEYKEEIEE